MDLSLHLIKCLGSYASGFHDLKPWKHLPSCKTTKYRNNKLNENLPEWPCFYPRQNNKHQTFCKPPLQKLSPRTHYSNTLYSLGSCFHCRIVHACPSGLFWHYYWRLHQTKWLFLRHPSEDLCNMGLWTILLSLNISAKRDDLLAHDRQEYLFFKTSITTLFQLWQGSHLTWLCQVYAVFSPYYLSWW